MFDADKTIEWLGYRMVRKLRQYVKQFSSDTGTLRTDGQNCYINIKIYFNHFPRVSPCPCLLCLVRVCELFWWQNNREMTDRQTDRQRNSSDHITAVGVVTSQWSHQLHSAAATSDSTWLSGRTLVFDRRAFAVLRSTYSWRVTTYVGKPSAAGQTTRPTQPFILSGSINEE